MCEVPTENGLSVHCELVVDSGRILDCKELTDSGQSVQCEVMAECSQPVECKELTKIGQSMQLYTARQWRSCKVSCTDRQRTGFRV